MHETFTTRSLVDSEVLRGLEKRDNSSALLRLTVLLVAFYTLVVLVGFVPLTPLAAAALSLLLGALWVTWFAPMHECSHRTAFRSRRLNLLGVWLASIPFIMTPTTYREFHFQHHRYTHDRRMDPEINFAPKIGDWPDSFISWLLRMSGIFLLVSKLMLLVQSAFFAPARWRGMDWMKMSKRHEAAWEARFLLLIWICLIALCVRYADGGGWLLFSLLLGNCFLAVWGASEHTGLPYGGDVLSRTRTTITAPFFRWWIWNMNFHAEHHAWPSVPWHRLAHLHGLVFQRLDHVERGYVRLQFRMLCSLINRKK